jgi:YfiH family protein
MTPRSDFRNAASTRGGEGDFQGTGSVQWIEPEWPAPRHVRALTTLRQGGCSAPPFAGLNLAAHVGDDAAAVAANRSRLLEALALPAEPVWLTQHHGTRVIDAAEVGIDRRADGAHTTMQGVACAILTADCLPILLCDLAGSEIAALHGGWRGLAAGIIATGLEAMRAPPERLIAWLGPAISAAHYEVGEDVRDAFTCTSTRLQAAFSPVRPGHFLCDLAAIARMQLEDLGVSQISGGSCCTYTETGRFYSFRRDGGGGRSTGRMATLIWMQPASR